MSSREKILSTVEGNQPEPRELPPLPTAVAANTQDPARGAYGSAASAATAPTDLATQFVAVLESIGGAAYTVSGFGAIAAILHEQFPAAHRVISGCPELTAFSPPTPAASTDTPTPPVAASAPGNTPLHAEDPHTLENVDLAILHAHFGVAENGACWITETQMLHRALPFITQHLALVIHRREIVADMHQAYDRIALLESAASASTASTAAGSLPAATPTAPYGFATFIAGPSKTADIEQSLVLGAHGPMSLTVFLLDEQLSDAGFY
jgi:L-lactate dehydrogenase complex protein LldG